MNAGRTLDFQKDGVCILLDVIAPEAVGILRDRIGEMVGARGGSRATDLPSEVRALIAPDGELTALARSLIGADARATRVLAFDKSADRNWGLGWHQDRAIAVKARAEAPGFKHWTVKQGVPHVEAPEDVLSCMVTLRLHLDDCGLDNGPLEIAADSCRAGAVPKGRIAELVSDMECLQCPAHAGDVLAMKGLTFHRSKPAKQPIHRRVLHVDYAADDLPGPLEWAQA